MRWLIVTVCLAVGTVAVAADAPNFDRQVAPILAGRCLVCHSGEQPEAKLDLSQAKTALGGGESGPALVAGSAADSLLWRRIEAGEMPPKHPLPASERATLKAWIAGGATWGADPIDRFRYTSATRAGYDWWSLQPLAASPRTDQPPVAAHNPIDRYIRAKLTEAGLTPSPAADPQTRLRRVYFDLIGLPPTPEEIEQFTARQPQRDAFLDVVDRLLASPHYGERWARHWLDVAHFGESDGFEFDKMRPHAWRYRNWVIDALNRDLPYDEFARLQIAGDVLRPDDPSAIIATGFLVGGAFDGLMPKGETMRQVMRQDELEDLVGVVSQTFLGLTVHCARCHDHKFDPIRQTDYYRLAAALAGVKRGNRDVLVPPGKQQAFAVTPLEAPVVHRLLRGNVEQPAEAVAAGGIASLTASEPDFGLPPDASDGERRAKLAAWIASEKNPLLARTIVNRLWQHHFGSGLVETPSDLGFSGGRPSHPELLNFLARELIARGWSLKAIHRLIVTSETYQQSSRPRDDCLAADADNRLLWRCSPRRLEAETIRDAMLAISGQLNPQQGGPSFQDFRPYIYKTVQYYEPLDPEGPEFQRRSIYRFWARGGKNPLLDAFDCPDPSIAAPRRPATTTPLQALALLNNSFTLRMADALAERLQHERPDGPREHLERAFVLAYGRGPNAEEASASAAFVSEHGLPAFCRVLFNSNGFLYVH